jgi:hypothetical protein
VPDGRSLCYRATLECIDAKGQVAAWRAYVKSTVSELPSCARSGVFDSVERLDDASGMRSRRCRIAAILLLASCAQSPAFTWAAEGQKFRADEWITECDARSSAGTPDCSITVPFWQTWGDGLRSGPWP